MTVQINDINCQMIALAEQLRVFRRISNVINKSLVENILKVVEEINEFVDGNPKHAPEYSPELDFHCISYVRNVWRCNVCQANFKNCLFQHLSSLRHQNKLKEFKGRNNLALKSQDQFKPEATLKPEAEPKPSTSWQTDDDGEQSSLSSGEALQNLNILSKDIKHSYIDLPADKESIFQSRNSLDNYLNLMMTEIYPSIYNEFIEKFNNVFPNYMVYMCGPLAFGLQNFFSTQEVFVDTGNAFYEYPENSLTNVQRTINEIMVLNSYDDWEYLQPAESSEYPVLHVKLKCQPIKYILTFNNGLTYCKSRLVKYLLSVHPVVQQTCILLQKAVGDNKLDTYFDSYVVALLVICQYQMRGLLPSVNELQKATKIVLEIGPWRVNFGMKYWEVRKFSRHDPMRLIKQILIHLQSRLRKPSKCLLSPFLGNMSFRGKLLQQNFVENPDLKRYHDFCARTTPCQHLQTKSILCLQDPIELNKNLTAHIPPAVLTIFRQVVFKLTTEIKLF